MPDLLLEFFSEEIPARMQARAAEDLRKLVTDRLVDAGLVYEGARAFATPRRISLWVQGVPARQPDAREEKKGPRVGAPEKAIEGFLKSAGLASIDQAKVQPDKKGDFYVAVIEKPGRPAIKVIEEAVPEIVRAFPWPKSMRWGARSASPGALTWVRPLHSIVATFGPETEEPEIVPFAVDGVTAGDVTYGHRFLAPGAISVRRLGDYVKKLEAAKVVLDPVRRQEIILAEAKTLAFAQGYELVEDAGLLAEVAGLVEWPVVLMGAFDEAFLSIPPEVIRTTIRNNQKCFVLTRGADATSPLEGEGGGTAGATGRPPSLSLPLKGGGNAVATVASSSPATLAPRFILVANTEAADGGKAIVAGNERVIRARLADAKFFYETDLKTPLEARLEKLKQIVFHEKLGTQYERVERIARLAGEIADVLSSQPNFFSGKKLSPEEFAREQEAFRNKAVRAARLCKADLVTDMVGEFPELQGLMGKYYALAQGEDASVARAIEEHYKPLGPSDRVPADPVSVAVALADKIDTLVGFWAIDEKPTGSKDPYALRRAALGVIRLIVAAEVKIQLFSVIADALAWHLQEGGSLIERSLRSESPFSVRERTRKVLTAFPLLESYLFHGGLERNWLDCILDELSARHESEEADLTMLQSSLETTADVVYDDGNEAAWPAKSAQEAKEKLAELILRIQYLGYFSRAAPDQFRLGWLAEFMLRTATSSKMPEAGSLVVGLYAWEIAGDLRAFFVDRLKIQLREQGARHDLVDAVLVLSTTPWRGPPRGEKAVVATLDAIRNRAQSGAGPLRRELGEDDLLLIVRRVEALAKFLDTDDGKNLLAGYKRATNIIRIEEKKDGREYRGKPYPDLYLQKEERELAMAIHVAREDAEQAVAREDFAQAMHAIATLRPFVDAFFEHVTVNVTMADRRENRLMLLNEIREATRAVADFSKIEG